MSEGQLGAQLDSELIAKVVISNLESEAARFDALDSKAGLILGFGLVSIAEVVGFLLLAAVEAHTVAVGMTLAVRVFFYAGMGCLVVGSVCAMLGLRPRYFDRGENILAAGALVRGPTVRDVLEGVVRVRTGNAATLNQKAKYTEFAAVLVPVGIICLAVVAVLLFGSFSGKPGTGGIIFTGSCP